jgi:hypothetical protein
MKTIDDIRTENLQTLVKQCEGTTKFSERTGKSASQVSQWLNRSPNSITGRPRVISTASCRAVEEALELPPGWMDTEHTDGQPLRVEQEPAPYGVNAAQLVPLSFDPDDLAFVKVRMVTLRLSAGIRGFRTEPEEGPENALSVNVHWMRKNGYIPEKLIAMRVKGESMEPTLYDSDVILVNTLETTPVDGKVYAVNYEGEAVVKRMIRDAGRWWLSSDHQDQRKYHRKLCDGVECLVVGRVVLRESSHF